MKGDKGSIMPWLSLKGRAEDYSNEHIGSIINKFGPWQSPREGPQNWNGEIAEDNLPAGTQYKSLPFSKTT